jgi:hypothetical protein
MVPGVGLDRRAAGQVADAEYLARQDFLDRDDGRQHDERAGGGGFVGGGHLMGGGDGDGQGRPEEHQRDDSRSQRLGLAVAVRILLVGRPSGDAEPGPDDERGEDVGGGLDGVRHQGVGVAEDTGQELNDHEGRVDEQAR